MGSEAFLHDWIAWLPACYTYSSAAVKYYRIKQVLWYRLSIPYLKCLRPDVSWISFRFGCCGMWMHNTEWLGGEIQVWTQEFTFHLHLTHTAQMPFRVVFNASVWRDIGSDVGFSTCSLKSMFKNFGTLVTFGFSGGSMCLTCIYQGHMESGEHLKREWMQSQVLIQRVKGRPLWMEGRWGG